MYLYGAQKQYNHAQKKYHSHYPWSELSLSHITFCPTSKLSPSHHIPFRTGLPVLLGSTSWSPRTCYRNTNTTIRTV